MDEPSLARSKEPFAMELLDAETATTEKNSFDVDSETSKSTFKRSKPAGTAENKWDLHIIDASQHTTRIAEKEMDSMKGPRANYENRITETELEDATDNGDNLQCTIFDHFTSQTHRSRSGDEQDYQENVQPERSESEEPELGRLDEGVEGTREVQLNHRNVNLDFQKDRSAPEMDHDYQQNIGRDHREIEGSSVASDMLKNTAREAARKTSAKATISAETKARWAMLRTLAGTGKDGEGEADDRNENPSTFEPKVAQNGKSGNEGSSLSLEKSSLDTSFQSNQPQRYRRDVDFGDNKRHFIRSSKAAVESAIRRDSHSRRQSSRGDFAESDSSLSRAASVKRYMEKLRNDPHIDETHFAGLPAVKEVLNEASAPRTDQDLRKVDQKIENSFDELKKEVGHDGHQAEINFEHRELHLHQHATRVEDAIQSQEQSLAKDVEDEDHHASRLERDAEKIEVSLEQKEHSLVDQRHDITAAFASNERELRHDAHQVELDTEKRAKELKGTLNHFSRSVGLEKIRGALVKEERKMEQDIDKIEGAAGLDEIEQIFNRKAREIRQEAGGKLGEEARNLEREVHSVRGNLGFGRLETALKNEERHVEQDAHEIEGEIDMGKHLLSNALDFGQPQQQPRRDLESPNKPETSRLGPQQHVTEQRTPQRHGNEQQTPQHNAPQQYPPQQHVPQKQAPTQEIPHKHALQQQAHQTQAPQQHAPQTQTSQQQAPQKQAPQQRVPPKEAPQKQAPEQKAPPVKAPEQQASQKKSPQQQIPEQHAPQKQAAEQHTNQKIPRPQALQPQRPPSQGPQPQGLQPQRLPSQGPQPQHPLPHQNTPSLLQKSPAQQDLNQKTPHQEQSVFQKPLSSIRPGFQASQTPSHQQSLTQQTSRQQKLPAQQQIPDHQLARSQQQRPQSPNLGATRKQESNVPTPGPKLETSQNVPEVKQPGWRPSHAYVPIESDKQPSAPASGGLDPAQKQKESDDESIRRPTLPQSSSSPQPLYKEPSPNVRNDFSQQPSNPRDQPNQPPQRPPEPQSQSPTRSHDDDLNMSETPKANSFQPQAMETKSKATDWPKSDHRTAGSSKSNSTCTEGERQDNPEAKPNPQKSKQSSHCASSVQDDAADHTATSSTISMSPRLDPSEFCPNSPSPHMAVFEHLIHGFKQSSGSRAAAGRGNRGFTDQMTELFIQMAEDALPAIQQRLENNARG